MVRPGCRRGWKTLFKFPEDRSEWQAHLYIHLLKTPRITAVIWGSFFTLYNFSWDVCKQQQKRTIFLWRRILIDCLFLKSTSYSAREKNTLSSVVIHLQGVFSRCLKVYKKMYPHAFFFKCMFVLWHLFTLARPDYPHTPPTQTHTHTPKHLYTWARNKKEVWIMLAHRDREAKQSSSWKHREQSPETKESFCEGWREEGKGWSTAALGRGRVGLRGATVQPQSAVAVPVHTHAQTETQTNSYHSSPHRARLISCQSLRARPIPGGGRKTEWDGWIGRW